MAKAPARRARGVADYEAARGQLAPSSADRLRQLEYANRTRGLEEALRALERLSGAVNPNGRTRGGIMGPAALREHLAAIIAILRGGGLEDTTQLRAAIADAYGARSLPSGDPLECVKHLGELLQKLEKDVAFYRARAAAVADAGAELKPKCVCCGTPMLVTLDERQSRVRDLLSAYNKKRATRARRGGELSISEDERFDGELEGLSAALRVVGCCLRCEATAVPIP